ARLPPRPFEVRWMKAVCWVGGRARLGGADGCRLRRSPCSVEYTRASSSMGIQGPFSGVLHQTCGLMQAVRHAVPLLRRGRPAYDTQARHDDATFSPPAPPCPAVVSTGLAWTCNVLGSVFTPPRLGGHCRRFEHSLSTETALVEFAECAARFRPGGQTAQSLGLYFSLVPIL